ncbi:Protein N-acetyltransferase, RimJ/RimL family [Seinonella peptonophila]|uniref:Protein N-acetyltransferase, RimJ/RimL family n=1 Tax=Seinonella peptonophila TaxID=112248 RepID=A0A1M4SLZ7_9BACL|nr:GNAT family N-acetyltransferase [Seinonella peptonophila]SHE33215.1 Protein N-acetyltransferase, RimJ/RimL family [Seinonella peptonophila]
MNSFIFEHPPTLQNDRIQLVPMQEKHAIDLFKISDKAIWKFMLQQMETLKDMQTWVKQAIQMRKEHHALPFAVIHKENQHIIGATRLYEFNFIQKSCELGATWYQKNYQRTFVNTDCKLLLLQYCFETLGMIRVQLKTDERNLPSQKAIERLGAKKEGLLRNERILENGYIRNAYIYSIIQSEWSQVKENLLRKVNEYKS